MPPSSQTEWRYFWPLAVVGKMNNYRENSSNPKRNFYESAKVVLNPVVLRLGLVSFFADVASEMLYPVTPIFLTTVVGAFQNCSGSFKSVTQETDSNSNSQTAGGEPDGGSGSPGAVTPTTPVFEYGNYKAVSGITNLIHLNNRICNLDSSGAVSCMGTFEQAGTGDAENYPRSYFSDHLTNMNLGLNIKKILDNCLLTVDEKVYCHRHNVYGELGLPGGNPRYSFIPIQINLS